MIILDTTTKSLEIILPGAVTTNQLPFTTGYVDTVSGGPALVESDGVTNSGVAVTLVSAPSSGAQHIVKHLSVVNADTVSQKVTIRINNNATLRNLFIATLAVGDNLIYTADGGFQIFDLNGNVKQSLLSLPLGVGSGGTGVSTLTAHGVLVGEGTSSVVATSAGAANTVLHGNTGADPSFSAVVEGDLSLSDVTTDDVSSTKHGFAPKSPAAATQFLNGAATPAFAQVKDSDLSVSDVTTNNVSITAHGFTPKAPNDTTKFLRGDATWAVPAGAAPVGATTTSTGTVNDFAPAGITFVAGQTTILRCNNATALTITGLAGGVDGAALLVENIGTSTVRVTNQDTGSTTATDRIICPSTNGQIIGGSGAMLLVYDGTTQRWREELVDPGAWITVAYNAGDYTAGGSMTWTVESGDLDFFAYKQRGTTVEIGFYIKTSTIGGTPSNSLLVKVPGGFTNSGNPYAPGFVDQTGSAGKLGLFRAISGNTTITIINSDGSNFTTVTNTFYTGFSGIIAVQ